MCKVSFALIAVTVLLSINSVVGAPDFDGCASPYFNQNRVKELRAYLAQRHMDCFDCTEKHELVSKAREAHNASTGGASCNPKAKADKKYQPQPGKSRKAQPEKVAADSKPLARQSLPEINDNILRLTMVFGTIAAGLWGCFTIVGWMRRKRYRTMAEMEALNTPTDAPLLPAAELALEVDDDADAAQCRICLSTELPEELFCPCKCAGTAQYVHQGCLRQWRLQSSNSSFFYECQQCKYKYGLRRFIVADLLSILIIDDSSSLHHYGLQALLVGIAACGMTAFTVIVLTEGTHLLAPIEVARKILNDFWVSDEEFTPGDVVATFLMLTLLVSQLGLIVSDLARGILQRMERYLVGQVEDIRAASA